MGIFKYVPLRYVLYPLAVAVILVLLWVGRAEITTVLWRTTHVAPEVLLAINPNAALALEMGGYFFDAPGNDRGPYDIGRAEVFYGKALEIDPEAPLAWHQLARIAFLESRFDLALSYADKQLEQPGEDYRHTYYVRGLIYGYRGDFNEAVDDFVKYVSLDPYSWAAYNDLAWLYFQNGDFETVLDLAEEGLVRAPRNPWLLMVRGVALYNLDLSEEARVYLEQAQEQAQNLTEQDWSTAYPGNDPRIAEQGLGEFLAAIASNLELVNSEVSQESDETL